MTRNDLTIALSSAAGDPRLERTWSGTPYNLMKSLEELGEAVLPIDASLSRPVKAFCRLTQRMMGFIGHSDRGPVARRIAARRTERACLQAGIGAVLHTGSLDLPGTKSGNGLNRYLFCDSTWDLSTRYSMQMSRFSAGSSRVCDKLELKAFQQAKGLFPIAHYVRDNLITHYRVNPDKTTVVGTGRGKIAPFQGAKEYANWTVLFVAKERFEEKGGRLLLEGFRIAKKKKPPLKLVLAGKAVEGTEAGGAENITVAGRVPWEELQRLFETASLFAMPAYNEPWGLVYLEALACRTPLLGLARNSLPELTQAGRFGFLVKEPNPNAIGQAILEAFADPEKLKEMGCEGQKYCLETFSWPRTASMIRDRMLAGQAA